MVEHYEQKELKRLRIEADEAINLIFKDAEKSQLKSLSNEQRARVRSIILKMTGAARTERDRLLSGKPNSNRPYYSCIVGIAAASSFGEKSDPELLELAATLERIDESIPKLEAETSPN